MLALGVMAFGIPTLVIMTISVTTLVIMTLGIPTLVIVTLVNTRRSKVMILPLQLRHPWQGIRLCQASKLKMYPL